MTSPREKLAALINRHFYPNEAQDVTLDALCAIVEEARREAIEECSELPALLGLKDEVASAEHHQGGGYGGQKVSPPSRLAYIQPSALKMLRWYLSEFDAQTLALKSKVTP